MAVTINASTSSGLAMTADGSGIMKLQSNGVTTNALAWVNFNGVTTATIRSSYNVSSVTRNGTGDYTVNFSNALSDANYSALITVNYQAALTLAQANTNSAGVEVAPTASAFRFITITTAAASVDAKYANVAIFGN